MLPTVAGGSDIAIDLLNDHVYWTAIDPTLTSGAIWQAGLDGSNPTPIITGLNFPVGIDVVVPEPTTLVMLTVVCVLLTGRRRAV